MFRRWVVVARLAVALVAIGWADVNIARQEHASGTLYTRVSNGVVRAAVAIEVHLDRHLYHTDVGGDLDEFGDRYPGKPLRLVSRGTGITWSEPRVPEPERYVDVQLGNWANVHSGTFTVYLRGELAVDADLSDFRVELSGLTCSTVDKSCIRLRQVLETSGEGPDEVFAEFPESWAGIER